MRISHNELFAHRHLYIVMIIVLLCVFTASMFLYTYTITRDQIITHYRQTFEKKAWSGIEIFHGASQAAIAEYFSKNIDVVTNIASDEEFHTALTTNDLEFVTGILKRQLTINQRFNNLGILDNQGIFIVSASNQGDIQQFIGQDFSQRSYYQKTIQTKRATFTTIFGTATGRDVVIFSAPVLSADGEVEYVINGTVFLSTLSEKMPLKNVFEEFDLAVGDSSGNIIFSGNDPVPSERGGGYQHPVIERLMNGEDEVLAEFANDQQHVVFAKGSSIPIGQDDKLFVVASYDKAQFQEDIRVLQEKVRAIYSQLERRILLFGLVNLVIIIIILKRHDMAAHHL